MSAQQPPPRPPPNVARTWARLRFARWLLLVLAIGLAVRVGWSIWTRRPASESGSRAPITSPETPGAIRTLEKFSYTSSVSGERAWSITADRLVSLAAGLYKVEGIRSFEFPLRDGRILRGRADHATFVQPARTGDTDPGKGHLVLEGAVRIEGKDGELFESERIEYLGKEDRIVSPGPLRFRFAGAAGSGGRMIYDVSKERVAVEAGVRATIVSPGEEETRVRADRMEGPTDGTAADLAGSVRIERGGDTIEAPSVRLERPRPGAGPSRMIAGSPATARLTTSRAPGGGPQGGSPAPSDAGRPVVLRADRLEATQAAGKGFSAVRLSGHASIREEPTGETGAPGQSLEAPEILIREDGVRTLSASGGVTAVFPPAPGETRSRRLTSATLEAITDDRGALREGEAAGKVRLIDGTRSARAEHMRFFGETRVELRGSRPRVEEPDRSMTADEIDIVTDPPRIEGRGAARTRIIPRSKDEAGPFAPGVPVDVSSRSAVIERKTGIARFEGKVLARQGERALSCSTLTLGETERTARAEGPVSLRGIREETPKPGGAGGTVGAGGPASAPPRPASAVRVPVRIDADALTHDGKTETTRFEGHAVYREPGRILRAERLTTTGASGGQLGEALAENSVSFEGDGKKGSADIAIYRAAERTITLTGRSRPARVTETATGRTWSGASLTWTLAADSIPVVGGASGRSRISGPAPPSREEVGRQPADRKRTGQDLPPTPGR